MAGAIWDRKGDEKRVAVQAMFDGIAPRYDVLNGLMCAGMHRRWRNAAVRTLSLKSGDTALDICAGTGDFLLPLREAVGPSGRLLAIDFSAPMLAQTERKDAHAGQTLGDAGHLPVRSGIANAVTVGWGIRNVPDIDLAHREAFRVLAPGGRFVSVDMAIPEGRFSAALSRLVFRSFVPFLGRLFGHPEAYAYLPESTERFLDREGLDDSMRRAGFVEVTHRDLMFGNLCLHLGAKP